MLAPSLSLFLWRVEGQMHAQQEEETRNKDEAMPPQGSPWNMTEALGDGDLYWNLH